MTVLSEAVLRGESAPFCWSPSIGGGNPHNNLWAWKREHPLTGN